MDRRKSFKIIAASVAALLAPITAFAKKRRDVRLLEVPDYPFTSKFVEVDEIAAIESIESSRAFISSTNHSLDFDIRTLYISDIYLKGWSDWCPPSDSKHYGWRNNPMIISSTVCAEDLVAEYNRLMKEVE